MFYNVWFWVLDTTKPVLITIVFKIAHLGGDLCVVIGLVVMFDVSWRVECLYDGFSGYVWKSSENYAQLSSSELEGPPTPTFIGYSEPNNSSHMNEMRTERIKHECKAQSKH